jgi:hypothetical protein
MPPKVDDRVRLLHGPYQAPKLRVGDRVTCLFRDCLVVVTGWTDARISWPRCRPLDVPRSHPSLLVDEELARAARRESAAAVGFWWGVSVGIVWRWRKALGVTRTSNEGSRRLILAAARKGAAGVHEVARANARGLCDPEAAWRPADADLARRRHLRGCPVQPRWTPQDAALAVSDSCRCNWWMTPPSCLATANSRSSVRPAWLVPGERKGKTCPLSRPTLAERGRRR